MRLIRVEQRRPDLRFPFPERFAERLEGRRIISLNRRAKYLVAALDDGAALIAHLGMSGAFRILAPDEQETEPLGEYFRKNLKIAAHDHVVLHMESGVRVVYNDPRRFGFMTLASEAELGAHPFFAGLGVEPLSNDFGPATLAGLFKGKKTPLKAALLDQKLIAGLGNIYVCEALHRSGLSPSRPAGDLVRADGSPTAKGSALARAIRDVLVEAVAAGGSSLRDHRQTDGSLGYFQHKFKVYGRTGEACVTPGCGGTIGKLTQSGRSTFFCPQCQS
jgi:formamidopyrimidine-DNA glycosylase